MAINYTYTLHPAATNGVVLQSIKTSPKNIRLKNINPVSNLASQSSYGINGGYFNFTNYDILNIAVNNDVPVKGTAGSYGVGWNNEGAYLRGTLVWDDAAGTFSVVSCTDAGAIYVTNRTRYWAQGGISMTLSDDLQWRQIAGLENMQNPDGLAERAGMVYNNANSLWLVVTNSNCTAGQFRAAIKEKVGSNTLVDGIFLDGSGSAQLKCAGGSALGDGRSVPEMVSLIQTT
jgi:hypothetical protein